MHIKNVALCAALSLATAFGVSGPANAAPIAPQPIASPAAGIVETVGYKVRRGFVKRNGIYYYNGYRGHRYKRAGYRYHRGYYFPRRAFTIHIQIGPRHYRPRYKHHRVIRVGRNHVNWCYAKYRSYRASDNTFQPYHGPRKRCRSPYGR